MCELNMEVPAPGISRSGYDYGSGRKGKSRFSSCSTRLWSGAIFNYTRLTKRPYRIGVSARSADQTSENSRFDDPGPTLMRHYRRHHMGGGCARPGARIGRRQQSKSGSETNHRSGDLRGAPAAPFFFGSSCLPEITRGKERGAGASGHARREWPGGDGGGAAHRRAAVRRSNAGVAVLYDCKNRITSRSVAPGGCQIAVPGGGPAMRGGLRP